MLIPVNQNIDDYKDDFYKGLTLRQSVISLITVVVGVCVYLAFTGLFHLPQSLSLYMTLPVVFPIAAYGFLKIHGMNIAEYIRKSGAVKEHSSYAFIPQMLMENSSGDVVNPEDKRVQEGNRIQVTGSRSSFKTGNGKGRGKQKILYLETEESIREVVDQGKGEMLSV